MPPDDLLKLSPAEAADYKQEVADLNKDLRDKINGLKRTKTRDVKQELKEIQSAKKTIESYLEAIQHVESLQDYTTPKKEQV